MLERSTDQAMAQSKKCGEGPASDRLGWEALTAAGLSEADAARGIACKRCGAPLEGQFKRGALLACSVPPRIYWRGEHLSLSPMQARIMVMLVQFGCASFDDLAALSTVNSLRGIFVATTGLRRRLPAGVQIVTRRRWGYALEQRR